jgi:hypothetical protein
MALELIFTRGLKGLEPADEEAREAMKKWKIGAAIKGKFSGTRENPHRRYWYGMVQLVLDNSDLFASKDACADSIKLSVGHVLQAQEYRNGQWSITRTPATVAGDALDNDQWRDLNRRTERLICEVLCVSQQQLADAMVEYIAPGFHRDGKTRGRAA